MQTNVSMQGEYPVVGTWPRHPWWKGSGRGPKTSIRLPGILRVDYREWAHYEWYVPMSENRHRYLQLAAKSASVRRGRLGRTAFISQNGTSEA